MMPRSLGLVLEASRAVHATRESTGRTREQLMLAMHAVRPDGTLLVGADVFREAWSLVGLRWLVAPSRWPLLRRVVDAGYRVFARHRVRLGRLFGRRCDAERCTLR